MLVVVAVSHTMARGAEAASTSGSGLMEYVAVIRDNKRFRILWIGEVSLLFRASVIPLRDFVDRPGDRGRDGCVVWIREGSLGMSLYCSGSSST